QPPTGRNLFGADAWSISTWLFRLVHTRCRRNIAQYSLHQACHGVGRYTFIGPLVLAPEVLRPVGVLEMQVAANHPLPGPVTVEPPRVEATDSGWYLTSGSELPVVTLK